MKKEKLKRLPEPKKELREKLKDKPKKRREKSLRLSWMTEEKLMKQI